MFTPEIPAAHLTAVLVILAPRPCSTMAIGRSLSLGGAAAAASSDRRT